jgi:Flp pilus assembly protein TadB
MTTLAASPLDLPAAPLVLALALLLGGGRPGRHRVRGLTTPAGPATAPERVVRPGWALVGALAAGLLGGTLAGPAVGIGVAVAAGLAAGFADRVTARWAVRGRDRGRVDAAGLAHSWELLAVCLQAGLPVPTAVSAATESLTGTTGDRLRRVAGLLQLGADPAVAWAGVEPVAELATFARAAGRSATTGAALAQVARAESARLRADVLDSAHGRAQRAAVLITGPLGLCFLPAFVVLGIVPVLVGLASTAFAQW